MPRPSTAARSASLQRPLRCDRDAMENRVDLRGEDRLAGEVEVDFLKRALARQRGVEDVEGSGVPARRRRVALQRVAFGADDAPDIAFERDALMGIKRIEEGEVARPPLRHDLTSDIGAGVEPLDHPEHLFGPAGIDQVDGPLVVQERVARMEPEPRLVGRVEVGQPVDNVAKVGDDRLGLEARRAGAPRPARDGRSRDVDDVGDVLALQPAAGAQVIQKYGRRRWSWPGTPVSVMSTAVTY